MRPKECWRWSTPDQAPFSRTPDDEPIAALEPVGVSADDVDIVVNTNRHWDQCNGNHLFPKAAIPVQARETVLFGGLPERTRLLRALRAQHPATERFLADPTVFTVIDTYGIELIHPWRYGRSPRQVGRKGWSNHRWIVGLKLCWLVNARGEVVAWAWNTASVGDQTFAGLAAPLKGPASP